MARRMSSNEAWAELQRLQAIRSRLEEDLDDKKLDATKRAALEAELAATRRAIGKIVVR